MNQFLAVDPVGTMFLELSDVAVRRACEQGSTLRFYPVRLDEYYRPSLGPAVTIEDYFRREREHGQAGY